ncbi:snare associated Golgi protein-domain-containing protein [Globomyces pollinis-pini]|nr:snare associated Golgi protein-domain-containing protein [Globomyces pollinis-pini]
MFKKHQMLILALLVVSCTYLGFENYNTILDSIDTTIQYINDNQIMGSIIYVVLFGIMSCMLIPVTLPIIIAGVIFKPLYLSVLLVQLGSHFGVLLSIYLGKYFLKPWLNVKLQNPKYKSIDLALAEKGWTIVILLRLSPIIPYGLCNYLLAGSSIPLWTLMFASIIGGMPLISVYCAFGSLLGPYSIKDSIQLPLYIKLLTGLLSICFVLYSTVYITLITKKELRKFDYRKLTDMEKSDTMKSNDYLPHELQLLCLMKVFIGVALIVGISSIYLFASPF